MFDFGLLLIFPAFMILGGVFDMLTMTIPNRISLILVGSFLFVAIAAGLSPQQIGLHLAVGFGVLLVTFTLFALGGFGGGDAKLIAASSLWMGFDQLLPYIIAVGIYGGVLSLVVLIFRNAVPDVYILRFNWAHRLHTKDGGIPYGVAIAAAALTVFPGTLIYQALSVAA
ncbi:MAG: A24 family peptidase [Hyphomicrobiaceae bacterium]